MYTISSLLFLGLFDTFNGAGSKSDCIASHGMLTMYNNLEKM
jgi:hypothetical protein